MFGLNRSEEMQLGALYVHIMILTQCVHYESVHELGAISQEVLHLDLIPTPPVKGP